MNFNYSNTAELRAKVVRALGLGLSVFFVHSMIVDHHRTAKPKLGVKLSWKSAWCGVHYSPFNKRVGINFVPFVTVYYVWKGGLLP